MAAESEFVKAAKEVAEKTLLPPLYIKQSAPLLYQITVNNLLEINADLVKKPTRGNSAFQTDLCVFEKKSEDVSIPRVVMEFKTSITTHDVLTYSAKASKHKQVYPYLRYGIVASSETSVPSRLFTHNDSLDFCACVSGLEGKDLEDFFASLISDEVRSSRLLEKIAFPTKRRRTRLFRNEVKFFDMSNDGILVEVTDI